MFECTGHSRLGDGTEAEGAGDGKDEPTKESAIHSSFHRK
jgi:hypothetical protein